MLKYDTLVVGGGSSGAVLAARLSEDPQRSVLLLEAGPDFPNLEQLPHDIHNAFTVSVVDHDWGYKAEVVPGRMMDYARGKVTGGCSAINGTIALRGTPADYDLWAALGNDDWSWEKSLPYFRQLEHDHDAGGENHGRGGPIPIVRARRNELVPLQRAFLEACLEKGFNYVADHNHPTSTGVGPIPMNRQGDLRVSTAVAYLNPARHRLNLSIRAGCLVDRVLFEGTKAVGVRVESGGQLQDVYADEIVISAGAIHTPPILMRSGIGAADALHGLGIDVLLDQPAVGRNLVEHQQITAGIIPEEGVTRPDDPDVQIIVRYTAPGTDAFNNMQIYFVSRYVPESHRPISAMSVLQKPKCRGSVELTSIDPHEQPKITLNSYGEPEDMRIALDGLRLCWELVSSKQISAHSMGPATLSQEVIDSDDKLWQYVRDNCATIWHPVGTAKMGPDSDPTAVVDQHGRVRGLQNLRVADASIFPEHVSANPNLTCLVIGQRVAGWIMDGK